MPEASFRRLRRHLGWVPAVVLCRVGWDGITPLDPDRVPGHFYPLVGAPLLLFVFVVAWAGRVNWLAYALARAACALAAYLPWAEQSRETEGFEYEFNNTMGAAACCCMGYGVLVFTTFLVLVTSLVAKATSGCGRTIQSPSRPREPGPR